MGPIKEDDLDLRVSDILTSDLQWNKKRIEELLPLYAEKIQGLQPSLKGMEDTYIWQPLATGVYTTRSGYNSAVGEAQPRNETSNINSQDFHWIKDLWAKEYSPKLKVFVWSIIQGAIPLGENLQKRGMGLDVWCPHCKEPETPLHTFFLCEFASKVWANIPLKETVHIAVGDSFKVAITRFRQAICLPPVGVSTDIMPWICWSIWKDRNSRLFENRGSTPEEIAIRGIRLAREWNQAQQANEKKEKNLPRVDNQQRQPTTNLIECRTDAAWNKGKKRAGLAWVFNGLPNTLQRSGSTTQDFVTSPLIAEALAIRSGLCMAATMELPKLKVCSDSSTLIAAINNKYQMKEIVGIVRDIQEISSGFDFISFTHISRKNNGEADSLAKQALGLSLCNI
ncbi:uncharacterized protein LOC130510113 [Raphanus sativus]|uniref:Uncharacterized protein LOC130510113 n=1 Tax=Raphanus sativus TaxID=3726 RepID=A0A9W3DF44_RAPSA|nr:uncharacterized protein LOC130510113 [Raphanus sativus]